VLTLTQWAETKNFGSVETLFSTPFVWAIPSQFQTQVKERKLQPVSLAWFNFQLTTPDSLIYRRFAYSKIAVKLKSL